MIRRKTEQAADDARTVARVRGALEGYAATAPGRDVHVSVGHVLDLLNPHGLWSYDAGRREAAGEPELPEGHDPVTGCRPVTAPGQ